MRTSLRSLSGNGRLGSLRSRVGLSTRARFARASGNADLASLALGHWAAWLAAARVSGAAHVLASLARRAWAARLASLACRAENLELAALTGRAGYLWLPNDEQR